MRCPATADLQVHMLVADGGAHHKFGSDRRWAYYLAAAHAGKCELLCRRCHQREEQAIARMRRQAEVLFWEVATKPDPSTVPASFVSTPIPGANRIV